MMYGGSPVTVANASQDVRMAFVRKVYGLFFVSILISVVAGFLTIQDRNTLIMAWDMHFPIWLVMFLIVLGFRWTKRIPGLNLFMLYLFSALGGVFLGPLCYIYDRMVPGLPLQAGVLSTAVFGGLTLYVMFTRQDFNFLGGFLFASLFALIVAGLVMMFFPVVQFMTTVYCIIGILIFAGYVLYDTSNILTRLRADEAPLGALELYLDFINLLVLIMRLLGGSRR